MIYRPRKFGSFLFLLVVAIVTVGACVGFVHRDQLLVYYYADSFVGSSSPNDEALEWLVQRPPIALPMLVEKLQSPKEEQCQRAASAIRAIIGSHTDPTDPKQSHLSLSVAAMLHAELRKLSARGRVQAVELSCGILREHLAQWSPNAPTALATAGSVFLSGLTDEDLCVQVAALERLSELWSWEGSDSIVKNSLVETWKWRCYQRGVDLMDSRSPRVRAAAATSLQGAPFNDGDSRLVGLLNDQEPQVRKAALATIALSAAESLSSESHYWRLVELLDDPDEEIRGLARKVFLAAGLSEEHLQIAILLRNKDPRERAKIPSILMAKSGLGTKRWLMELVRDPAPSVRIEALRAAAGLRDPEFREVFKHLATDDPDEQVRKECEILLQKSDQISAVDAPGKN